MQNRSSWPIFLSLLLVLLFDYYTFLHYGGHNTRQFFFTLRPRDTVTASTKKEKTEKESAGFIFCCSLFLFHDDYVLSIKKDSPTPVSFPFFFLFTLPILILFPPLAPLTTQESSEAVDGCQSYGLVQTTFIS